MERKTGPESGFVHDEVTKDFLPTGVTSEGALVWRDGKTDEHGRQIREPIVLPVRVDIHGFTGGGSALVFAHLSAEPGYRYSKSQLSCGLPRVAVIEEGLAVALGCVSKNVINKIRSRLAESGFGFCFSKDEIELIFGHEIGFDDPRALEWTTRPVIVDVGGSEDAPGGDGAGGGAAGGEGGGDSGADDD